MKGNELLLNIVCLKMQIIVQNLKFNNTSYRILPLRIQKLKINLGLEVKFILHEMPFQCLIYSREVKLKIQLKNYFVII